MSDERTQLIVVATYLFDIERTISDHYQEYSDRADRFLRLSEYFKAVSDKYRSLNDLFKETRQWDE